MKKIILFTIALLLSITSFAQSKIDFGLRAGINSAQITKIDTKRKTDFYFGAFLAVNFSELYTLQPELTYTREGAILNSTYNLNDKNKNLDNIELDFISLAIMSKFKFNDFHASIGPYVGIAINDNVTNNNSIFGDLDKLFPKVDLGFTLGVGYNISNSFAIDARIKLGVEDMINESYINNNINVNGTNNNQVIQLGIAYKFNR